MKRFQFGLEKILSLRAYRERERELELAEITMRCNRLRAVAVSSRNERREVLAGRSEYSGDIERLRVSEAYMQALEQRASQAEEQLLSLEDERLAAQERFLEASREKKVLENLKDRRKQDHRRISLQEEHKDIDDINTGRTILRRMD